MTFSQLKEKYDKTGNTKPVKAAVIRGEITKDEYFEITGKEFKE